MPLFVVCYLVCCYYLSVMVDSALRVALLSLQKIDATNVRFW